MNTTRMIVILSLLLSGCSSCQHSGEEAGGGGAPAGKAVATLGAAAQGKIQAAPVVPTMAARAPQPAGQGGAPAGEGQGAAPAASEKAGESDCIVVIDANPDYGPPPLAVAFSAEAECSSGEPTIKWNFGDDSGGSAEMNPSHTYAKPGDYVASATVTSPNGAAASDEIDITVEEGEAAAPQ